jgi:predicted transcriptional regulator
MMASDPDLKKFEMRMTPELVELLDAEAVRLDRSRTWVIAHAAELWVNRLQRDRERREAKRKFQG